ncbi:hypothetical protein WA026_005606 [Henosepilachna vigintioctopunctata]|uniref:Uncharacterized protein n=1 Tax=Henosepilachna vigintioctopunctata TaxID=420089 RepID=A0AAW1U1N4_9CUCU
MTHHFITYSPKIYGGSGVYTQSAFPLQTLIPTECKKIASKSHEEANVLKVHLTSSTPSAETLLLRGFTLLLPVSTYSIGGIRRRAPSIQLSTDSMFCM